MTVNCGKAEGYTNGTLRSRICTECPRSSDCHQDLVQSAYTPVIRMYTGVPMSSQADHPRPLSNKSVTRTAPSTKAEAAAAPNTRPNLARMSAGASPVRPKSKLLAAPMLTVTESPSLLENVSNPSALENPSNRNHSSRLTRSACTNTLQYFPKNGSIDEKNSFLDKLTRDSLTRFCGPVEGKFWADKLNLTEPTTAKSPAKTPRGHRRGHL